MKTMTCKQIGGPCSYEIIANLPEDMIKEGMKHLERYHPEIAKKIINMSLEDNRNWRHSFLKTWRMTANNMR